MGGLPAGALGTIVMAYPGVRPGYEVEFCDDNGITLALLTLYDKDPQQRPIVGTPRPLNLPRTPLGPVFGAVRAYCRAQKLLRVRLLSRRPNAMRHRNLYRDVVLTVIAGLLAWATLIKVDSKTVHAQPKAAYAVEKITIKGRSRQPEADLASAINTAAKGRELITIVHLYGRSFLAVYK